jgi:hypothetical protein
VVISFLLMMLIYSSASIHSVFAQHYGYGSPEPCFDNSKCVSSCYWSAAYGANPSTGYWKDETCTWVDSSGFYWSQTCSWSFGYYYGSSTDRIYGCSGEKPYHPPRLANPLPPSAGLLNGALNPSNATGIMKAGSSSPITPPVSIIKLPPGTTPIKIPPGAFKPAGNITGVLPAGNNTIATPPPVSIIKPLPGMANPTGTAANPSNGGKTAMAESGGGGQTETCLPGQTANTELGTCQDPVCGPGQVRDPTGQTRYCVNITCPPGENFNTDINQCVVNPIPPPPKCPDGTVGIVIHEPNGISVVECPKSLPTGTSPLGGIIKVPPGATSALPGVGSTTNNGTGTPFKTGIVSPIRNVTNAPPIGNSSSPPCVGPLCNPLPLAKPSLGTGQVPSLHHHHKAGSTSSSSNTNSTGH